MKTPPALAKGLALVLVMLSALPAQAETSTLDRIVAVVNDEVILASELDEEVALIQQRMRQQGETPPRKDTLRKELLEELISERLQLQRADQYGISVDDDAVDRALRNIAEDNGTDLTGLRERFADEGLDFARVREDIRKRMTIEQLRQRAVASQISVSEQDIEEFVGRMEREEGEDAEFRVQHILISAPGDADPEATDAARRRAQELAGDLRDGGDFAATARELSDGPQADSGGDLGWRSRDQLPSLFVDALQGLRPGDVSEPVQSANGFHILRLADQRGGVDETITETRARHILIRAEEDGDIDDSEARDRIADLRRRLEAGASFPDLASGHSDDAASAREGGDLGWFGPGEMSPAFQEAVDELDRGELSEPFRTRYGWHIVEVLDRRQRDDAERYQRARARQALYRQRIEEETQRWLRELRDEAFVDKRLDG